MKIYVEKEKQAYFTPQLLIVIQDCEIECNSSFESKDNDFGADGLFK